MSGNLSPAFFEGVGGDAIYIRSFTTTRIGDVVSGESAYSIPPPSGTVVGDLLVFCYQSYTAAFSSTGWTVRGSIAGGYQAVVCRTADGGANDTFNMDATAAGANSLYIAKMYALASLDPAKSVAWLSNGTSNLTAATDLLIKAITVGTDSGPSLVMAQYSKNGSSLSGTQPTMALPTAAGFVDYVNYAESVQVIFYEVLWAGQGWVYQSAAAAIDAQTLDPTPVVSTDIRTQYLRFHLV